MARDELKEACSAYLKLLQDTEDMNSVLIALARESFIEGWVQCERRRGLDRG
jgi:hypothetical protein